MNKIYKGVVKLDSDEQYQELMTAGTVTLASGEVVKYSPDDTEYITPMTDEENNFVLDGAVISSGDKFNIGIGDGAKPLGTGNINIGTQATNTLTTTGSVVIGGYASGNADKIVAIGQNARGEAEQAIQLGQGTNQKEKSLQVLTDNIYDASTHTLTVQNAQVNGKDIYGVTKKTYTNISINTIMSEIDPSTIKEITLKFRNDTNMQGASFQVYTSSTGQTIKEFESSTAALIVVANEIHHFVKSYSYESNYEFVSGNYKLAKNGTDIPVLSYIGVQHTTDDGTAAQCYQAKTVADFIVDATIILE